jgi:hypothetical protein
MENFSRELHLAFIIMCPANTLCTSNEIIMSWMFKFPAHKNPSLILQAFLSSSSSFGQQPQKLLLHEFGTFSSAKQKSLRKENRKFGIFFFSSSPNLFEEEFATISVFCLWILGLR